MFWMQKNPPMMEEGRSWEDEGVAVGGVSWLPELQIAGNEFLFFERKEVSMGEHRKGLLLHHSTQALASF